jgi:3-hydroxyacyl-CoA dehydrogenase
MLRILAANHAKDKHVSESSPVRLEKEGDVGVIVVDYPPVNALGPGVSDGIIDVLNQGNADPDIRAMVLIGAGRSFIAGADIRGFGTGRKRAPIGSRTYDVLDASPKPVIAAIHGFALGGGLENAMACHYRIAVPSAKVGLPEVQIGILPGGGGTQRLPRLAGPKVALEMITSGRHVPAPEALRYGILDEVLPEGADLRASAVAFARRVVDRRPLPRVRDCAVQVDDPGMFDAMRKSIARRARNQKAPYHCIAAVEASCTLPFDAGIARENELFNELENSDEARALRYAFFAEREVAKLPDLGDVAPRDFHAPAVIGAGTMGGGIAMSATT